MHRLLIIPSILLLSACSGMQPVIYPNEYSSEQSQATIQRDIAMCEKLATNAGATENSNTKDVAGKTARAGAVGAASGAVGGAIAGSTGEGAAIGAASAATTQLIYSMFSEPEPNLVYQNFVTRCLLEKGYDISGWN